MFYMDKKIINLNYTLPQISLVIPCFNEEEVLISSNKLLVRLLNKMKSSGLVSSDSFILYVNDGSIDQTWEIIKHLAKEYQEIKGICLSSNCGHQNALVAGLNFVSDKSDASITIDADLQDDIQVIPEMVRLFTKGFEVVYGIRKNRDSDSWFKRFSAQSFYKTMKSMGVECLYNHADFRLLSKRAIYDLLAYEEINLFLRCIVPKLGYKQTSVEYERKERKAGQTKYPLKKMIEFAIDGITSFSIKPVRMVAWIGLLFMIFSSTIAIYSFIRYSSGDTIKGWTSLMLSIWFCTGVLLLSLGIIGEYIGKIYLEVKHRPRFSIAEVI